MKKILLFTVLTLLLLNVLVPVFQGCTKESSKTDNQNIPPVLSLEKLVSNYNDGVMLKHEQALLMQGELTILTLPSREVLFFLKKTGASAYEIFLGQGEELSSMIVEEAGNVKLAYLREALVIETAGGDLYTFTIGERKGHEMVQQLNAQWKGKGFGLVYYFNSNLTPSNFKNLASTSDLRASECKCRLFDASDDDCDSGGQGSVSCSIGATTSDPGCSTTCATGYFACCQTE